MSHWSLVPNTLAGASLLVCRTVSFAMLEMPGSQVGNGLKCGEPIYQ
jgi:hypothetical protein